MTPFYTNATIQAGTRRLEVSPRPVSTERRASIRFPLELRVRYQTVGRGDPVAGEGWVVNISSSGVLVAHQEEIPTGVQMELNIEWPSLLDGRVPLRLVTLIRVVRCDSNRFAGVLGPYQFRTTSRTLTAAAAGGVIPIDASRGVARV
jgi:hypothetical protein